MSIGKIAISVAVLNYEKDRRILESVLRSVESMVHAKDTFVVSEAQYAMGWYFFNLLVDYDLIPKLANFLGSEFLQINGKSLEDKFLNWLAFKLKEYACDAKLDLVERKESTKYGLF